MRLTSQYIPGTKKKLLALLTQYFTQKYENQQLIKIWYNYGVINRVLSENKEMKVKALSQKNA